MPTKKQRPGRPLNRAVDDEDPNYSPMEDMPRRKRADETKQHRTPPEDLPGAAGFTSARADEDTYD